MKQETKEIISELTQCMINANNKYYEERKIAKQEILDAIDNIKRHLYFYGNDFLNSSIKFELDKIKENMYKV